MNKQVLKAEKRTLTGRNVKNLRKQGIIPANVYGKGVKSEALQINLKEFQLLYKQVGETGLVTLEIGKEEKPVLIHNMQLNPVSEDLYHVDFLQVNLKEKVEADVPVELTGESPAEKQGIGTVVQYINEIKVEALPTDLPEKFEIDVTLLTDVDQSVMVKDLKVDRSKVEIKTDAEELIVKVEPPQKEEVVETPIVPVGAEGAVPVEGEVPAEGQPAEASKDEPQK